MKPTILLVEDETIVGLNTAHMLETHGFDVVIADTGEDALDIVHRQHLDLILMDIDLGEEVLDGAETAKRIMSEYEIPIIFLTNYTEPQIVEKTSDIASYGYVIKNSGDAVILATINSAFRLHEKQKKAQGKLQQLIENQNDIIYSIDPRTEEFSYISPAFRRILGYTEEDIRDMGGRKSFLSAVILNNAFTEQSRLLKELETEKNIDIQQHISIWKCKNGEEKYIEDNWVPVYKNGKLDSAYGVLRDVTERMETRERLTKALREKEYLMEEIHHRVKNNLTLILSLIHFKSLEENCELSDLQQQIVAIGSVHDKLFQSNDLASVDFPVYLHNLLESVFFSMASFPVTLEMDIPPLSLTAKAAVPLGLIINEIALNAIKHGFETDRPALFTISIGLHPEQDTFILQISNNGKVFPENISLEHTGTLGLRLIKDLLEQLQGKMEIERAPHPKFTFSFPLHIITDKDSPF